MKKQKAKWPWDAPGLSPEKKVELFKQWTLDCLREQLSVEIEREEARWDDIAEPLTDALPRHIIVRRRYDPRPRILAAIKSKDWKTVAQLTKDDSVREWAWREYLTRSPGRRKGELRKGQRSYERDREVLAELANLAERIGVIWKTHGVRQVAASFHLTAEQLAAEFLLGPKAEWEAERNSVPASAWLVYSEEPPPVSWEKRRRQLELRLKNWKKNKPRRKSAR